MELFESYDRRIDKILGVLKEYGIGSVEECRDICAAAGIDPYQIVKTVQPIAFENAGWAYTVGAVAYTHLPSRWSWKRAANGPNRY